MFKKDKFFTKKKIFIISTLLVFITGLFLVYASSSNNYYYFPEKYIENEGKINLGVFAGGKYNAIDYYKGGYGIYLEGGTGNSTKPLTSLEIRNPALHGGGVEIWGDDSSTIGQSCIAPNTPSGCWSVYYIFTWKAPNGTNYSSKVVYYDRNPTYSDITTGYVNVIPDILKNAWNIDMNEPENLSLTQNSLVLHKNSPRLLVEVRFGDDVEYEDSNTISFYKDVSKKFNFRVRQDEVRYIGIASSDKELFDGETGYVKPEDLSKLNFATVHLGPNPPNNSFSYKAPIEPGRTAFNLIDIDVDNIHYDSRSRPEMYTYIVVWLYRRGDDGELFLVDKNGNSTTRPIALITPQKDGIEGRYPAVDTSITQWSVGPSGSFDHCTVSIGSPNFRQCYDANIHPDTLLNLGIRQHRIDIPYFDGLQAVKVDVREAQRNGVLGNAFALASDIDLGIEEIDFDDYIQDEPTPPDEIDEGEETSTGVILDGLESITYVEINPDDGLDFNDDGKITNLRNIHTYKTKYCNITEDEELENVMTKLTIPEKTILVGSSTPDEVNNSSLMLSGSNLDNPIDNNKKIPISAFDTDINLGNLEAGECTFLTYQVRLEDDTENGHEYIIQNEFKYGDLEYEFTNEVKNTLLIRESLSIGLESNPMSGSDVYNGDMIEYRVTVRNDGDTDTGPGEVTCPRMIDTTETFCSIGECRDEYTYDNILAGESISYNYIVEIRNSDDVPNNTNIFEQCTLNDDITSNEVEHRVLVDTTDITGGGNFYLFLNSRPKLLNSPDGNPRPDGYDRSPIQYTYRYTGSNLSPMYPEQSNPGGYWLSRGGCGAMYLPYRPNSYTYNVNSANTNSTHNLNLSSNNQNFGLNTTLPNATPRTTLHAGTLTPTHYVPGNEVNNWYKNGGDRVLPITSTEHRALVNGTNGRIDSSISGTARLDRWQYRAYSTSTCSYICGCGEFSCWSCTVSYPLYRWEVTSSNNIPFNTSAFRNVTVGGSTAWVKTEGSHVHTNDRLSGDGSISNTYDLGESGYDNISSAPKLYSPPGASHGDYVVSSNNSTSSLSSSKGWYIYDKEVPMGHGYVYDRENNSRDFYYDLLESQKFGKVVQEGLPNPIRDFDMELNHIYYYPGDLTINNPSGTSIFSGFKGTIVVGGDLYINSSIKYSQEEKNRIEDLVILGLIVRGDVYIDPRVEETSGTWFVEGTLNTGEAVKQLKHYGSWTASDINFQRKAPEFFERDVNEPSEWIVFNDQVYITTPPGFTQLDDGVWSYHFNVNQFSGEIIDW